MPLFADAYKTLNTSQKKAVDTVEGPVLVIAGPGTGKTHILTLRIANILEKTQATPSNILVLTFTESAARTVRARLAELIGDQVAREVWIGTFHGFCEHVLSTHAEAFPAQTGKRLAGDVQATLIWREVLETDELVHLRTPKSPFFYLNDLARLRDDLVRECISLDTYRAWAKEQEEVIRNDESLRYVRGEKKGELKPEGYKKIERLEKIHEAARLIEAYEQLKEKYNVYDFADVLRIVVDGIKNDDALRAELQETYQYILADEHQDANGLQHALLDTLAYDEHPNLFVVGDERQAIYRFQGADSTHFEEFRHRYPRTEVIELTESFRSLQAILDLSQGLAERQGTYEPLKATREGQARMKLLAAPDPLAERDQVAGLVQEAIAEGVPPHEIAIIAAKNATADIFAAVLSARGIPVLRAGDVHLSSRPVLRALLCFMRAVSNPLDTPALRESLLAPWWDMSLSDRAELLARTRDRDLMDTLTREQPAIAQIVSRLQEQALSKAPLELFSLILQESGLRAFMLSHAYHLDDLVLLRKLYMHLEDIVAQDPNISFKQVVELLTKAHEHGLENVKSSLTQREGMVTVITAHKAKGMEFKRVFVVGLTAREWEKGGRSAVIPSPVDSARSVEDVIRLFFVAVTRAKDELVLSYAKESGDGRETPPSSLIPVNLEEVDVPYDPLPITHTTVKAPELVRRLTCHYLQTEGLSPSALNEYLESPACFFAKRVLRLREPETPALVVGIAVHSGIAAYLKDKDEEKAHAELERSLKRSLLPRNQAYENIATFARQSLSAYIAHNPSPADPVAIEKAYSTKRTVNGTEVLLQGKVDAVFNYDGGECIVDFKTTSTIKADDEDYPRQLAFYDLLLRENGHDPKTARIVQIGTEEVKEHPVKLDADTRAELLGTLDQVFIELMQGEWREGVSTEYDALLELFKD